MVVSAFVAGDAATEFDEEVPPGGHSRPPSRSLTLDLNGAGPGDVVALLVRGGNGRESDPGDFGTIRVVITG